MKSSKLPRANKTLGQHFLSSDKVIKAICDDFSKEAEAIVEIGPGPGILTKHLSKIEKPFIVVEKDKRFPEILKEFIPLDAIYNEDALEIDLNSIFIKNKIDSKNIWLVSNLPYNISVPLLMKFLKNTQIKFMTLMFQREVAEKIFIENLSNKERLKSMNSLHALTGNFFKVSHLIKAPPGAFTPPPKVDSTVLSFDRIENPDIPLNEFKDFEKFLRILFSQRRKQIQSVLKKTFNEELVQRKLENASIDPKARAETLKYEEVKLLYKSFKTS